MKKPSTLDGRGISILAGYAVVTELWESLSTGYLYLYRLNWYLPDIEWVLAWEWLQSLGAPVAVVLTFLYGKDRAQSVIARWRARIPRELVDQTIERDYDRPQMRGPTVNAPGVAADWRASVTAVGPETSAAALPPVKPPNVVLGDRPSAVRRSVPARTAAPASVGEQIIDDAFKPQKNYFRRSELVCKGGAKGICDCDFIGMDPDTMEIANRAREKFGPLYCRSGYRCSVYNATLPNSSERSQHILGKAIDLHPLVPGVTARMVYDWLESEYPDTLGLGLYKDFVHIDSRTIRARWDETTK